MAQFRFDKKIFFFFFFLIFSFPSFSFADNYGEKKIFFVNEDYDFLKREKVSAFLVKVSENAYFYLEENYWFGLSSFDRQEVFDSINYLAEEFNFKIYPTLTSYFGSEWKPGIDNDPKITIFFHRMGEGVAGYFRDADEYEKLQSPRSNEREMIYLNLALLKEREKMKAYLAHEFLHLITFNQKKRILKINEEVWLNELRAEIAPAILGYSNYLKDRINKFLSAPQDSLLEWKNDFKDYASVSLFAHYLYDHYGVKIFVDSLQEKYGNVLALNNTLKKNGFQEDFSQIFRNWLYTLIIGDCSFGEKFCYKNEELKNFKILPQLNILPNSGESTLTIYRATKDWAGNWQKFVGGRGYLTLEFNGNKAAIFDTSYLLCDKLNQCQIKELPLNEERYGKAVFPEFDKNYSSIVFVVFSKTKSEKLDQESKEHNFSLNISLNSILIPNQSTTSGTTTLGNISNATSATTSNSNTLISTSSNSTLQKISCNQLPRNLKVGMSGKDVKCLQEFLKSQGREIYPEGLITGYFGPLTLRAVIKFQEKYKGEVLLPWGILKGTGFVGIRTRLKINQILRELSF